jgi:D-beta-D-heptose 7-phosphate kinase/D-beta-D-heptose 1-phosphate adenosyltransferase
MVKNKKSLYNFVQNKMDQCKVLVIGDVMLDKYYFSEVKKISPEAPVPVAKVVTQKETLGGAANVANNLALLGAQTYLVGSVGDDYHRIGLEQQLAEKNIDYRGLICSKGPTTTKLRVMGGHQQMIRLDFEETTPLQQAEEEQIYIYLEQLFATGLDSVIISDYAKGVCTFGICQRAIQLCNRYSIPIIIDPKGNIWDKYAGADYLTPNLKEINEVMPESILNEDIAIIKGAVYLKEQHRIKNIMVTRSEKGLSLITSGQTTHIPTLAQEVFDVSGAGDTVIAVMALALAGKLAPADAAFLANLAASVVVAKLGTYAIRQEELLAALSKI